MEANNGINLDTSNSPRMQQWHFSDPVVEPFCQGVIVSNEWVLTHADCNGLQHQKFKMKRNQS